MRLDGGLRDLLEPVDKAMIRRMLDSKVIGTDGTPVTVRDHDGKGSRTGRLWAYLDDRDKPFVVYDYTPDRSRDGPELFLKTHTSGYLQRPSLRGRHSPTAVFKTPRASSSPPSCCRSTGGPMIESSKRRTPVAAGSDAASRCTLPSSESRAPRSSGFGQGGRR